MNKTFVTHRRIEFCETDLAGIVHFANYYRYMEQAEHEFFRSLGLSIHGTLPDGTVFGWPRVAASCSFKSPARYDEVIEVLVTVQRLTSRSLTTTYEFKRDGVLLATGEMKTAYCLIPTGGTLTSAEIPPGYAERMSNA